MARAAFDPRAANIWTARIIPVILIGLVGYVTWVIIVLLCVDYLLKPSSSSHAPRSSTAVAIIVIYSLLFLLIALTYFRLLHTVATNPGYVPRGPRWYANKEKQKIVNPKPGKPKRKPKDLREKTNGTAGVPNEQNGNYEYPEGPPVQEYGISEQQSNLRNFYSRDAFACEGDGRPVWCSTCLNFKPDRAHHCREVGRCVRKMDHFCPWVGGVVSESSFNFFLQFVGWAAAYWIFNLAVMAFFVAESRRETRTLNVHWIVTLACGALFGLFTAGMTLSSMHFVLLNITTIENLSRHTKVWSLAILMPSSLEHSTPLPFNTITYPLGYVHPNQDDPFPQTSASNPRRFAILHSKPGENIWDLGYWRNFKSVMGEKWYDWLLPIKHSPCCNHGSHASHFEMGLVVDRMRENAGLRVPYDSAKPERRRRGKRRVQRTSLSEDRATRRSRRRGKPEVELELGDARDTDRVACS